MYSSCTHNVLIVWLWFVLAAGRFSIPTSPNNVRVRSLREVDLTKTQGGGMPCRDSKLRLSASETQYFALCSVDLFGPYVDRSKECRFWDSWVKHIAYLRIMLQSEIKVTDLVKMSALIEEHQELFAQVRGPPPHAAPTALAARCSLLTAPPEYIAGARVSEEGGWRRHQVQSALEAQAPLPAAPPPRHAATRPSSAQLGDTGVTATRATTRSSRRSPRAPISKTSASEWQTYGEFCAILNSSTERMLHF